MFEKLLNIFRIHLLLETKSSFLWVTFGACDWSEIPTNEKPETQVKQKENRTFFVIYQASTIRLPNADLTLAHVPRRCANIQPTLGKRIVFARYYDTSVWSRNSMASVISTELFGLPGAWPPDWTRVALTLDRRRRRRTNVKTTRV